MEPLACVLEGVDSTLLSLAYKSYTAETYLPTAHTRLTAGPTGGQVGYMKYPFKQMKKMSKMFFLNFYSLLLTMQQIIL